jgi:hypothetical protein
MNGIRHDMGADQDAEGLIARVHIVHSITSDLAAMLLSEKSLASSRAAICKNKNILVIPTSVTVSRDGSCFRLVSVLDSSNYNLRY